MDNLGFVIGGYLLTGVSLIGYVAWLRRRARRAAERAATLSGDRRA